jgi:hypothetical protein
VHSGYSKKEGGQSRRVSSPTGENNRGQIKVSTNISEYFELTPIFCGSYSLTIGEKGVYPSYTPEAIVPEIDR